jgi:hypothetical protein
MAGPSDSLGRAVVQLTAENSELKAKLAESERRLRQYGNVGVREVRRVDAAFASQTRSIRQSVGAVTSFVGRMTAAVGTFKLFLQTGETLGLAFRTNAEAAKDILDNIDVSTAQTAYRDLNAEVQQLTDQITKRDSGNWLQRQVVAIQQLFDKNYEEQLSTVKASQLSTRNQIAQQNRRAQEQEVVDKWNRVADRWERLAERQEGQFTLSAEAATLEAIRQELVRMGQGGRP